MRTTITEALAKRAEPGFIRDDKVIGFAVRTTKNGFKSFIAEGRVNGRMRRFVIGSVERWTVADARNKARQILADMDQGVDPGKAQSAARARTHACFDVGRIP
jgi:hypothetical protein